jgi:hypothetical protein
MSTPTTPPSYLSPFQEVMKGWQWVMGQMLIFGGAPWLLNLVTDAAPPWPSINRTCFYAAVVAWIAVILPYLNLQRVAQYKIRKVANWVVVGIVVLIIVNLVLDSFFVLEYEGQEDKVVKGWVLRETMSEIVPEMMTASEAIESAEYDATEVYTAWSVAVVRSGMIVAWLAFFGLLSWFMSMFVLHERKRFGKASPK